MRVATTFVAILWAVIFLGRLVPFINSYFQIHSQLWLLPWFVLAALLVAGYVRYNSRIKDLVFVRRLIQVLLPEQERNSTQLISGALGVIIVLIINGFATEPAKSILIMLLGELFLLRIYRLQSSSPN